MTRVLCLVAMLAASASAAGGSPRGFWAGWPLPKVWLAFVFASIGLALLVSGRVSRRVRLVFLGVSFVLWGVVPALSLGEFSRGMVLRPSPVSMVARPFQFLATGRVIPPVFLGLLLAVVLMSLAGTKLFCGWVCPIGALQELVHAVPLRRGAKRIVPFAVSNSIRIGFFAVFLGVLLLTGRYLYSYVSPFDALKWGFVLPAAGVLALTLIAALFVFRPFCYFLCPLGLLTWVLEQVALTKVRLGGSCTDCKRCVRESPCPTVGAILAEKPIRPDCYACGRCMEVCKDSLKWR
ncbi:4Fe-4S binding protein [Candidatus Fermentibacteria bacterium]|nr:4Fe-4S binding protein [Candidatus Fermentibacteria bacterium]